MPTDKKVRVAIVGLGFGAEFIPIYQRHPNAEMYAICRRDQKELDAVGDRFGIKTRYTSYEELLKDPNVDAVHINSPIADHAPQSIAALKAGKHVASTVPAATTIDECQQIVEWQRKSGKVYMMMETVVYSREYLFAKELYDKGELGRIQFMRGSHQQDMDGWPGYWEGFPPMHYATHCVSPCLAILGKHAEHVVCHGSGRIDEHLIPKYGSPFAIETATFKLRDSDVAAEVTRSLFDDRAAVPRELRRLRLEEVVRVAAGRERRAGHPHEEHGGEAADRSADSRAREGAGLRAPAAGADPALHAAGGDPGRRAPVVPAGRRPRRLAPAPRPQLPAGVRRREGRHARRRDLGQLDDGRHLRAPVGAQERREDRDSEILSNARVLEGLNAEVKDRIEPLLQPFSIQHSSIV